MSRSERLLDLIQVLRRHRTPVSGKALADELGISIRTLYRDIVTLQGQGADIEGEPGLGYVLRPGFMLPPLMFSEDELEALVLGQRWVARRADRRLGDAAENALSKISAVLPADLREKVDANGLLVGPSVDAPADRIDLADIRRAIRAERKLEIAYAVDGGERTERTVWPLALGFFERVRMLISWCELRQDFRNFRTDRILSLRPTETRYPGKRQVFLKRWKEAEQAHRTNALGRPDCGSMLPFSDSSSS
ncbi:YafY family protein [Mesorhizobium sp. BE184]|uniref:helix-turn-helix transcriptional regulator n=1 Tax=Mesorhizobium sp. BE184 TaxID=2817714 RepID=UPI00285B45AF|nr:YafY family protein [Mesorhizobium sp. BE184]MDR7034797.1 putative DNA-binding transcriptional regulator YafY [Mesorhizobium sp. BE184]